jgi:hypothetical protein
MKQGGITTVRQLKKIYKQQKEILKEMREMKESQAEILESVITSNPNPNDQSMWRTDMDDPLVGDVTQLAGAVSVVGAFGSFITYTSNKLLDEDTQKRVCERTKSSHILFEQDHNNCLTMDYWDKKDLTRLSHEVEPKKSWWNKTWFCSD